MENLLHHIDSDEFHAMEKEVTIFFSDIRGFTNISEKMNNAKNLIEYLNTYMEPMSNIIIKYDGTIDKYIGDAVMGIFGAPVSSENHAKDACYAAIEYQQALKLLREKEKNRGVAEIYARIGINTGEMIVGNMGCSIGEQSKFNYTVIGDEVNLASRLEGANKFYGTEIMISSFT